MFRMSIWTMDFERFLRFICPGFPSCRGHGQTPFFFVPNRPKRSKFIGDETTTGQTGARVQLLKVFHDTSHEFIRIVGKSHINIRKSSILKLTTVWIAQKIIGEPAWCCGTAKRIPMFSTTKDSYMCWEKWDGDVGFLVLHNCYELCKQFCEHHCLQWLPEFGASLATLHMKVANEQLGGGFIF